jgi:hypothetical protein
VRSVAAMHNQRSSRATPRSAGGRRRLGAPLSATERQRRGCAHPRERGAARRRCEESPSNSAPPCGAEATPQNKNNDLDSNALIVRDASQRTGVTRTSANTALSDTAALNGMTRTAGIEKEGSEGPGPPSLDVEALLERVAARQAERAPVLELIASHAQQRALEVSGWGLDRAWPAGRLREAWVVARYGQSAAAESGAGGAPLHGEDYARLRRAVARYERNRSARPDGFPEGGARGAASSRGALATHLGDGERACAADVALRDRRV